jgi:hypothetical protein
MIGSKVHKSEEADKAPTLLPALAVADDAKLLNP